MVLGGRRYTRGKKRKEKKKKRNGKDDTLGTYYGARARSSYRIQSCPSKLPPQCMMGRFSDVFHCNIKRVDA